MRAPQTLGALVGLLEEMVSGPGLEAPSGGPETVAMGLRSMGGAALRLIREAGYVDALHLERAIVRRTSAKWVYGARVTEALVLAQAAAVRERAGAGRRAA